MRKKKLNTRIHHVSDVRKIFKYSIKKHNLVEQGFTAEIQSNERTLNNTIWNLDVQILNRIGKPLTQQQPMWLKSSKWKVHLSDSYSQKNNL